MSNPVGPDPNGGNPTSQPMPAGPDDFKTINPTKGITTRSLAPSGERLSKKLVIAIGSIAVVAFTVIAYGLGIFNSSKSSTPVPTVVTMATASGGVDQTNLDNALPTPPPNAKGASTAAPADQPNPKISGTDELADSLAAASSPGPVPTFASTTPVPLPTGTAYSDVPAPPAQVATVPNPGGANLVPQPQYHAPPQQTSNLCVGSCVQGDSAVPTASPTAGPDRTGGSAPVAPPGGSLYEPQPPAQGSQTSGTGEYGQSVQTNAAGRKDVTNNNIDFANTKNSTDGYLLQTQHQPIGKYEIWAGNVIPAELDTGINTNLPGLATAHVTQDVYDSRTGQFLVIPKGTRIVGVYNSTVDQGQNRVEIKWSRLIWPDGKNMDLEDMSGGDREGNSGLFADVQDHRGAVLGASIVTAVLAAGTQIASGGGAGTYTTGSNGSVLFQSVGQSLAQQGGAIVQQKIAQPPELTVPRGENFNIIVDRTMVLAPWTYGG